MLKAAIIIAIVMFVADLSDMALPTPQQRTNKPNQSQITRPHKHKHKQNQPTYQPKQDNNPKQKQ